MFKNGAVLSLAMRPQHMAILSLVVVSLLIVPQPSLATFGKAGTSHEAELAPLSWTALRSIDTAPASARLLGPMNGTVDIAIALQSRDPQGLSLFLKEVSTPGSPLFDHFLTLKEFDGRFGSAASARAVVVQYIRDQSLTVTEVYPGGLVIDASGSAAAVGKAFHTGINMYRLQDGRTVFAASASPSMPSRLAWEVSGVSGLSNLVRLQPYWAWGQNTYQQGVQQQFFSPDLAVPNGLPSVYNSTASGVYGKGETVATVLWDGQRCSTYASNGTCSTWAGQSGPFDPATVSAYWKSYIPSWEPQPTVAGVPVDGAVAPSSGANYDATQAYVESTLDLEMAGSMAPGANITEVYAPSDPSSSGPQGPTIAQIDDAFTTAVTNPGKLASLNNVTVISNSWGAPEYQNNLPGGGYVFDAAWRNTLEQALATGITVLVSSGDSGNNSVNWPADIGNNTYGMVSVGGVTLNVTGTPATQKLTTACILGGLQCIPGIDTLPQSNTGSTVKGINYQDAWWFPAGTLNGQAYPSGGTTGGPSGYYKEPSWQSFALAGNSENPSPWRGDADIAGVANNTLIEIETCGLAGSSCTYLNSTDLISIAGTSVASPEDAGVLAILSGALGHKLGFIDPELYSLGYNETLGKLSANPFIDVTLGKNSNYPAQKGWDYPTGWGTLNASALLKDWTSAPVSTEYSVAFTESGLPPGTSWSVTLGGSTVPSTSSAITFVEPNGTYAYTVGAVSGYSASPSSGSIMVSGSNPSPVPITFSASSATLSSVLVSPASDSVSPGGSASFTATPMCTGGTCPSGVTYAWALNNTLGTLNSGSANPVTFTGGNSPGTVTLTVTAALNGKTANSSAPITITKTPVPILSYVSLIPHTTTVTTGGTVTFTATPSCTGGVCPSGATYVWTLSNTLGTLSSNSGNPVTFNAGTSAGQVTLSVRGTLNGAAVSNSSTITITTSSTSTLSSIVVNPPVETIGVGGTATFTATPTCTGGGSCPSGTTYAWSLTNGLGTLNSYSSPSVTFTAGGSAGAVSLYVNGTLNGVTRWNHTMITITSTTSATLATVSIGPDVTSLSTGTTQGYSATIQCSGGATCPAGVTYTWTLNDSIGSLSAASGQKTVFSAGNTTGTVKLTVTAVLNGRTASSSLVITVASANPAPSSSNLTLFIIIIGVMAAVVAIGLAAVLLRRRKGQVPVGAYAPQTLGQPAPWPGQGSYLGEAYYGYPQGGAPPPPLLPQTGAGEAPLGQDS